VIDAQKRPDEIAELEVQVETLVARLNEALQQIKLKKEVLRRLESGIDVHR
jgi:hypothetical protein